MTAAPAAGSPTAEWAVICGHHAWGVAAGGRGAGWYIGTVGSPDTRDISDLAFDGFGTTLRDLATLRQDLADDERWGRDIGDSGVAGVGWDELHGHWLVREGADRRADDVVRRLVRASGCGPDVRDVFYRIGRVVSWELDDAADSSVNRDAGLPDTDAGWYADEVAPRPTPATASAGPGVRGCVADIGLADEPVAGQNFCTTLHLTVDAYAPGSTEPVARETFEGVVASRAGLCDRLEAQAWQPGSPWRTAGDVIPLTGTWVVERWSRGDLETVAHQLVAACGPAPSADVLWSRMSRRLTWHGAEAYDARVNEAAGLPVPPGGFWDAT